MWCNKCMLGAKCTCCVFKAAVKSPNACGWALPDSSQIHCTSDFELIFSLLYIQKPFPIAIFFLTSYRLLIVSFQPKKAIHPGAGYEGVSEYKSVVYYQVKQPCWYETVKVSTLFLAPSAVDSCFDSCLLVKSQIILPYLEVSDKV